MIQTSTIFPIPGCFITETAKRTLGGKQCDQCKRMSCSVLSSNLNWIFYSITFSSEFITCFGQFFFNKTQRHWWEKDDLFSSNGTIGYPYARRVNFNPYVLWRVKMNSNDQRPMKIQSYNTARRKHRVKFFLRWIKQRFHRCDTRSAVFQASGLILLFKGCH